MGRCTLPIGVPHVSSANELALAPSTRQLAHWLAVVEEGSLSAAAKRLHISQPSLSREVRELERQLGGELLERLPRGTRLTPAGRALLPEARAVVAGAIRARRVVRESLSLDAGVLELATLTSLAAGPMLKPIQHWHAEHPSLPIRLHEYQYHSLLEDAVVAGTDDLGVGTRPARWAGPIERIGWAELVVALPEKDAALDADGPVALEDLAQRDWILYDRQQGLSHFVAQACATAGFQPRGVVETFQVGAAAQLAAAGLGVALVPIDNVPTGVLWAVRPLKQPLAWEIVAYTRTAWTLAARDFIDIMKRSVPQRKPRAAQILTPPT